MFKLTEKQLKKESEWKASHKCKYRKPNNEIYVGAIGGAITYSFTPTGIGIIIKIKCACGSELDLTETDNW